MLERIRRGLNKTYVDLMAGDNNSDTDYEVFKLGSFRRDIAKRVRLQMCNMTCACSMRS